MRLNSWWIFVAAALAVPDATRAASPGHVHLRRARGSSSPRTSASSRKAAAVAAAFLPSRSPPPSSFSSSPAPTTAWSIGGSSAACRYYYRRRRHRRQQQPKAWLPPSPLPPPPSRTGAARAKQRASSALVMMSGIILPSADGAARSNNNSPVLRAGGAAGSGGGGGGITLWLDMSTAVLPAAQTLKGLYDDLRQREEALGRSPEDPDWSLGRVPNPVGALLYAAEPAARAAQEMEALGSGGGGGALPCFRLSSTDEGKILDASSGGVVGVALDPGGGGGGSGSGFGVSPAAEIVAAAQQTGNGGIVLLGGLRPSAWDGGDMGTVLQIAASACAGAGKTLAVSVRSVGQLHDAAMAAFAASQTQVLGGGPSGGDAPPGEEEEGGEAPVVALLIEPMPELWEAGLLYL